MTSPVVDHEKKLLGRIRRGPRNASYTSISNHLIDHPTLSTDARIAQMYLLSKPENWELRIADLRRVLGMGEKRCGRNKTYEVLQELKNSDLVVPVDIRGGSGRYWRTIYFVFDEPHLDPVGFQRAERERLTTEMAQFENDPETADVQREPPHPEIRDAVAGTPNPCFRDTVNRDVTKERVLKNLPPYSPPEPRPPCRRGDREGEDLFEKIWKDWTPLFRPNFKEYSRKVFLKLSLEDRQSAVNNAGSYCALCRAQKRPPLLIRYLQERLFIEMEEGPAFDHDGSFVITPDRPEWEPHIASLQKKYGVRIASKAVSYGKLLTKTRWPEGHQTSTGSSTNATSSPPFQQLRCPPLRSGPAGDRTVNRRLGDKHRDEGRPGKNIDGLRRIEQGKE